MEFYKESSLDCKEFQPVHPKGDQSWVFIGRTDAEAESPILWPPHGVMGGAESEVTEKTRNVLLEGAAWNFINLRRTTKQHNLPSEASFRFSRGVHPALAETGVRRGLQRMAAWSGGTVAPGLADEYPLKPKEPHIELTPRDVKRLLGIDLTAEEIRGLLERLDFKCKIKETMLDTRKSKSMSRRSKIELSKLETRLSVTAPEIGRAHV